MAPRDRRWLERWAKHGRQRLTRWRRRWVPDWVYALCIAWRLVRSSAFQHALWSVEHAALGGPGSRGDLMRDKHAWAGMKEHCARQPAFIENTWRHLCAEREFLARAGAMTPPTWRRTLVLELAYLAYREQH